MWGLVPGPRMEPGPLALEAWGLRPTGKYVMTILKTGKQTFTQTGTTAVGSCSGRMISTLNTGWARGGLQPETRGGWGWWMENS